jgi:hypothetical protein
MNGLSLLALIGQKNPADLAAIEAQCGGLIQTIEVLAHVSAIAARFQQFPDPADGVLAVVNNNTDDLRYTFKDIGGFEGLLKLAPHLINIYRTMQKGK